MGIESSFYKKNRRIEKIIQKDNHEKEKVLDKKIVQNLMFKEIMDEKQLEAYKKVLLETGFDEKEINYVMSKINKLSDHELEKILAIPFELKFRILSTVKERINKGKNNLDDIIDLLINIADVNKCKSAYHTSIADIRPGEHYDPYIGKDVYTWDIKGTEHDHRDNNLPRAYASTSYESIYRDKKVKYLYAVSVGKTAKFDGDWVRQSSFNVIDKFNLREIDEEVNQKTKEYFEKNKTDVPEFV